MKSKVHIVGSKSFNDTLTRLDSLTQSVVWQARHEYAYMYRQSLKAFDWKQELATLKGYKPYGELLYGKRWAKVCYMLAYTGIQYTRLLSFFARGGRRLDRKEVI